MSNVWIDVSESLPQSPLVCVVLTPMDRVQLPVLWERSFAQYTNGQWWRVGSDTKVRNVHYWLALPKLPLQEGKR